MSEAKANFEYAISDAEQCMRPMIPRGVLV